MLSPLLVVTVATLSPLSVITGDTFFPVNTLSVLSPFSVKTVDILSVFSVCSVTLDDICSIFPLLTSKSLMSQKPLVRANLPLLPLNSTGMSLITADSSLRTALTTDSISTIGIHILIYSSTLE